MRRRTPALSPSLTTPCTPATGAAGGLDSDTHAPIRSAGRTGPVTLYAIGKPGGTGQERGRGTSSLSTLVCHLLTTQVDGGVRPRRALARRAGSGGPCSSGPWARVGHSSRIPRSPLRRAGHAARKPPVPDPPGEPHTVRHVHAGPSPSGYTTHAAGAWTGARAGDAPARRRSSESWAGAELRSRHH